MLIFTCESDKYHGGGHTETDKCAWSSMAWLVNTYTLTTTLRIHIFAKIDCLNHWMDHMDHILDSESVAEP